MSDVRQLIARANGMPGAIGESLNNFGGILRCTVCGRSEPMNNAGPYLAHGWPKCHGYTMTWVTQRLLDAEQEASDD